MTIDDEIKAERQRQRDLKAAGKFKHTCADPELTNFERLSILLEEMYEAIVECDGYYMGSFMLRAGNIARACNDGTDLRELVDSVRSVSIMFLANEPHFPPARAELIQVAAVCDAWLEALAKEHGQ